MLQAYSLNQSLVDGQAIPFNSEIIEKGCTAILAAPASIELNKAGVYMVECNATVTGGATGGAGTIQMTKNGVAQPYAKASETLATGALANLAFESLVQVPYNNSKCCCTSSPTTIQIIYEGVAATGDVNVVVTKLC